MKKVDLDPDRLDCTNLHGLRHCEEKIGRVQRNFSQTPRGEDNHGMGPIDVRPNPDDPDRYLVLDGHNRAHEASKRGELVTAIVYEETEEDKISNPIARKNFWSAPTAHRTVACRGLGTIRDLDKDLHNRGSGSH